MAVAWLQAGAAEGVYATGFVTFAGVPDFVHGNDHTSTLPLRRIEEVLTPAAVEEFVTRERAKVSTSSTGTPRVGEHHPCHSAYPCLPYSGTVLPVIATLLLASRLVRRIALQLPSAIKLEPLRLASGRRLDMAVGEPVPETTVAICNAAGQRLTRTFLQVRASSDAVRVVNLRMQELTFTGRALLLSRAHVHTGPEGVPAGAAAPGVPGAAPAVGLLRRRRGRCSRCGGRGGQCGHAAGGCCIATARARVPPLRYSCIDAEQQVNGLIA